MIRVTAADFEQWREAARKLLRAGVPPSEVRWSEAEESQTLELAFEEGGPELYVRPRFLELARSVSRHGDPARWAALYRVLYRLTHGERELLELETDADVERLLRMEREVLEGDLARPQGAAPFLPREGGLEAMREAVRACQGCDLYRWPIQAVFGEGPQHSRIVFVGEQPGDQEDLQGRPFVGPAGKLLDRALEEVGLPRSEVYITNAVKHFKFVRFQRGKRRLHQTPGAAEVAACRPWLEAEIGAIRPRLIVCLGATAAQSVMGRVVRVTRERGLFFPHPWADWVMVTIHPSALLRIEDPQQQELAYRSFVNDLKLAREKI